MARHWGAQLAEFMANQETKNGGLVVSGSELHTFTFHVCCQGLDFENGQNNTTEGDLNI